MARKKKTNPLVAIRNYCLHECCAGSTRERRDCQNISCTLHPFRMGKNTKLPKRKLSEEHKQKLRDNIAKAREVLKKNKKEI